MSEVNLLRRALKCIPGGGSTRSRAPGHVGPPLRPSQSLPEFPLFAKSGRGAYLTDSEGREYLDFAGANAAIPLGYAHPGVCEAVEAVLRGGNLLSLTSELEVAVSERLCGLIGLDAVRWVKTGSEAVSAAVRLARAHTGSSVVMVAEHSYHGWHDWTQARRDVDWAAFLPSRYTVMENGVPFADVEHLWAFRYAHDGELGAADIARRVRRGGYRVGAIVVEPHRFMPREPQVEALQKLRSLADEIGAVLVFDEMVFGFRWAVAGASEWCGVRPDLACYGKALGNGVPVACVAGREDIMARAERAGVSGTFGGERLGLAAAQAVMDAYGGTDVIGQLWGNGREFFRRYRELTDGSTLTPELWLDGAPVHFRLVAHWPELLDRVLVRCARQGVLFHRSANNASAAMTPAEARLAAEVLFDAVEEERVKEGGVS